VTIRQVNESLECHSFAVFAILAAMLYVFYILIVVQIALGLYSLWDGFEWFRMVRRRLRSHAGFYAPLAAVICPCKGVEPGLKENLAALAQFDYANYEICFSISNERDPAAKIAEEVKDGSQKPVHIVFAGPPEGCSGKVQNLIKAVESLPENIEVLVFVDSDARLSRGWLAKLIAPLQDSRLGATTAYRWIIPSRSIGSGGFSSALASAWNGAIATLLGRSRENFCWGGGTAIRRKTFEDEKVLEAWKGAVSDDLALTRTLEAAGKPILFCAECLAATTHPWTPASLLEFTNRQMLITRVYSPRRWLLGAGANVSYSLTLIYAAVVVLMTMASGDPWVQLALMAFLMVLLSAIKGALRTIAVVEMLPEWREQLNQWSWVWIVLAPVVPFLYTWNFIASLLTRRIRWRNIRYELVSPSVTRVLNRY
jgi:cellulose synthase/poly-beta-1,6-N-acetylglucosamine synthase-like glycosyltransferase